MTAPLAPDVNVKFRASGIPEVQRGLRLVGKEGETAGRQVGSSMRQIAGGVEMIARQGKVTGESLKQIISQGAEMAFMFGAGGPIVGALAIVGVAIYEHITNKMKEAREEINKTRGAIEDIRRSSDYGDVMRKQQTLYSGEVGAIRKEGESEAAFIARSRGLEGVRSKMGALAPGIPGHIMARIAAGDTSPVRGLVDRGDAARYNLFAQLFGLQGGLEQQYAEAQKRSTELGNAIGRGLQIGVEQAMKDAAEKAPLSDAVINRDRAWGQLIDPILKRGIPGISRASAGGTLTTAPVGGLDGYRTFGLKSADVGKQFEAGFVTPLGAQIYNSIVSGVGEAISTGFDTAFAKGANIGTVAAAMGGSVLRVIGGVFKDIGVQTLIGLSFMKKIQAAIATFNPVVGVAASIGLIALGSALQSAGGRMSANASGGSGGGGSYGGSAQPQIIDRGFINPASSVTAAGNASSRNMVVLAPTIIGVDSPSAQRAILELVRNAQQRGGIGGV